MKYPSPILKPYALTRFFKATFIAGILPVFLLLLSIQSGRAGSATWNMNPTSGDWNTASNWTPNTVPNGPSDLATFDASNITTASISADTEVNGIMFNPTGSAFTITVGSTSQLTLSGLGITNDSGVTQTIVNAVDFAGNAGLTNFTNAAHAGDCAFINNPSGAYRSPASGTQFFGNSTAGSGSFSNNGGEGDGALGGFTQFFDTSTAGNGTFVTSGAGWVFAEGGRTIFHDSSSGGDATFTNNGTFAGTGGHTGFFDTSTAASATFINNGGWGHFGGGEGGVVEFFNNSTAAAGTFTNNGGAGAGRSGKTIFNQRSNAGKAILIANPGSNDNGGSIEFLGRSSGGKARVEIFGNGILDISVHSTPGVTIGSLEGTGMVFLGSNNLSVGSNNSSTTFSGVIQDSGSLTKLGTGSLTLTIANTYIGGTTIEDGTFVVNNKHASGTGSGPVQINGGTLGGGGTVAGPVTIGTGNGDGAIISPGNAAGEPSVLTIQSALTFNSDATYKCGVNSDRTTANSVIANGVTISNGALFSCQDFGNSAMPPGTVVTVIDNTSATPLDGTFSNLTDGSTFIAGSNTFQVNYHGGDGNDLTLTVMP